jgi:hypothetical protein
MRRVTYFQNEVVLYFSSAKIVVQNKLKIKLQFHQDATLFLYNFLHLAEQKHKN